MRYHEQTLHITISAGVAALPEHGHDPKDVLNAADTALYQAKISGDAIVSSSPRRCFNHHVRGHEETVTTVNIV